jgi:phosphohistidine phosphatase SixA
MKAFIMRHCLTAIGPQMDSDRTLDETGEAQAHVMRKFCKRAEVHPDIILCSDFARAHDTAKIMQRGDTPIITTPLLRPDGDQSKAWAFVEKQAAKLDKDPDAGSVSVLIVTHSPLIYALWAAIAIPAFTDQNWIFHHGAIGYCNTHEARFRWYVNPKLAAHLVKEDPKEVENPVGEAEIISEICRSALPLTENLMAGARQATIAPLRNQMKTAITMRWTKQARRVRKALRRHTAEDPTATAAALAQVIPFHDPFFLKHHNRIKADAYRAGTHHAAAQLGVDIGGAVQGIEADVRRKPRIPPPPDSRIDDDGSDLEDALDKTTVDRAHAALHDLDPFTVAGAALAMSALFNGFTDPGEGKLSRADTVALQTVSDGYHGGGKDTAIEVADAGMVVEKSWETQDNPCEICIANEAEGWIPYDAPHDSGDYEPGAHPNCACSEVYRTVAADEEE